MLQSAPNRPPPTNYSTLCIVFSESPSAVACSRKVPTLTAITLGGTPEEWDETCNFFAYSPALGEKGMGKMLYGTKRTLRRGQMHGVWHFLNATYGQGRIGYINALDTGFGKTMVSLAIVAVLRTVEVMGLLCRGEPAKCPLAAQFDYQHCVCRARSLMSAIHRGLAEGITLFLEPKSTLTGARRAAEEFLERVVRLPDGTDCGFVHVVGHDSIRDVPFGKPPKIAVKPIKPPSSRGLGAGIANRNANRKTTSDPFESVNVGYEPCQAGLRLQDTTIEYTSDEKEMWFEKRHLLVVLPSEAGALRPANSLVARLTSSF